MWGVSHGGKNLILKSFLVILRRVGITDDKNFGKPQNCKKFESWKVNDAEATRSIMKGYWTEDHSPQSSQFEGNKIENEIPLQATSFHFR